MTINEIQNNTDNQEIILKKDLVAKNTAQAEEDKPMQRKTKTVTNGELKTELESIKKDIERVKWYMVDRSIKERFKLPQKDCEKNNPTSLRLYKDDKEAFDNLCKTKFKDINKDALFSMAIAEFVEKYKD